MLIEDMTFPAPLLQRCIQRFTVVPAGKAKAEVGYSATQRIRAMADEGVGRLAEHGLVGGGSEKQVDTLVRPRRLDLWVPGSPGLDVEFKLGLAEFNHGGTDLVDKPIACSRALKGHTPDVIFAVVTLLADPPFKNRLPQARNLVGAEKKLVELHDAFEKFGQLGDVDYHYVAVVDSIGARPARILHGTNPYEAFWSQLVTAYKRLNRWGQLALPIAA